MEVGLSVLLQPVDNGVVDNLEFNFFCLFLPLNFKSYFLMSSIIISEDVMKPSGTKSASKVSVLISNYPLTNGGYLVSFGRDEPDGSFQSVDPAHSADFVLYKFSKFLECSGIFLPKGCYYLPDKALAGFIRSLASDASFFEMRLLPASAQMQSLILVKVNEDSLFNYEQKKENKR